LWIIIGYEAFICCYFDQEDRDCVVCKKHMHYSVRIFLSQKFLGSGGVWDVTPGQKGRWKG
jgi:hypothetical protein